MASLADMMQLDYGSPELDLTEVEANLEDCSAGLSSGSILQWPKVVQD